MRRGRTRTTYSSTSWGSRRGTTARSTSWGRRGGHLVALLTTAVVGALAVPAGASTFAESAPTQVVVTGANAAGAVREVGATDIRTADLPTVAVATVTPAQARALARRGLRVEPDQDITLDVGGIGTPPVPAAEAPAVTAPAATLVPRPAIARLTGADHVRGRGAGTTIAVIDSGVDEVPGLEGRVIQGPDFTGTGRSDTYGHGTFVAGLAAGDGTGIDGEPTGIVGVAPKARILSVKVADRVGRSSVGKLVLGIGWVIAHQDEYDVDVMNLSLSARGEARFDYNPVNALVEAAWFSGITVVASSGNDGANVVKYAPGNDPWIITVGSVHDAGTVNTKDDTLSPFSNSGETVNGFAKPDVTSFGQHVRSTLPLGSTLAAKQKALGLPVGYGQLSGTSMSTAVVSGMVAVIVSKAPRITPDQVKSRLMAGRLKGLHQARWYHALGSSSRVPNVNAGLRPSVALAAAYAQLFAKTADYDSVDWPNVDWHAVPWADATWTDATWTNATWTNATWTNATWTNATWTNATWTDATWTNATWTDTATWTDGVDVE